MFIVTGGAGFIGRHIIRSLNEKGINDILVIDDLTDGTKFVNLVALHIADYMDKAEFIAQIISGQDFGNIEAILHFGANTSLSERNGKIMMEDNYEYSKHLLQYCIERNIKFIYASDAAVYGDTTKPLEAQEYEKPLNLYAFTKLQFDQYVRNIFIDADEHNEKRPQIVGLRYTQINKVKDPSHLSINEVCQLNSWLLENPQVFGIYNVGRAIKINTNKLKKIGYTIE